MSENEMPDGPETPIPIVTIYMTKQGYHVEAAPGVNPAAIMLTVVHGRLMELEQLVQKRPQILKASGPLPPIKERLS